MVRSTSTPEAAIQALQQTETAQQALERYTQSIIAAVRELAARSAEATPETVQAIRALDESVWDIVEEIEDRATGGRDG